MILLSRISDWRVDIGSCLGEMYITFLQRANDDACSASSNTLSANIVSLTQISRLLDQVVNSSL